MKKITKIEQQKRNKKRYSIFLEDEYTCSASDYIVAKYKLQEGIEIEEERLLEITKEDSLEKAKEYMLNYLSGKSEKKIRDRLKEKGYEYATIESVIQFGVTYNFINDESYAKNLVKNELHHKKRGKGLIKQKLKEKGIPEVIIQDVTAAISGEEEYLAATEVYQKKQEYYQKRSRNEFEFKRKMQVFLRSKGYSYSIIERVFEEKKS